MTTPLPPAVVDALRALVSRWSVCPDRSWQDLAEEAARIGIAYEESFRDRVVEDNGRAAYEQGTKAERARVVERLSNMAGGWIDEQGADALATAAKDIEEGRHV